jgi:hypothetical protein
VEWANGCSKNTRLRNADPGRKLHISIDADSDEIVAFDLTDKEVDDASHVEPLLEQLDDAPASFMGDGAYDRSHVLDTVIAKNPTVRFIVPPCKGAMLGSTNNHLSRLFGRRHGNDGSIFLQVPPDNAVACGAGRQGCVVALGVQRGLGKPQGLRVSVDRRQPPARPLWTARLTG